MRALIVGCGSVGRRHIRNLRQLCEVDLIAYRRTLRDAEALEREFGVRTFSRLKEAGKLKELS